MAQLNLNLTREFLKDLQTYMKLKGIPTKSEAIRCALREGVQRLTAARRQTSYRDWIGKALKAPPREGVKFKDEDSLWKE